MSQDQPFSATNPPDEKDTEACIEWAREIVRRNREFVESEQAQVRYEPNFPRFMGYIREED